MPIPARTARVLLLPGDAGRYLVTDVEVRYDAPGGFSIWDSCPSGKVSGPKLRAAMDARVAGRGWRRSGDWEPAETNAPWRGWIAPIEPIPEERPDETDR